MLGSIACATPPQAPAEQRVVWQPVSSWAGTASQQTESFTSQTGAFRFSWESAPTAAGKGRLTITLHSAVSGRPLVPVIDLQGAGRASAYVNEDPREFYVVVDASDTAWTLKVEEGISVLLSPAATTSR